MDKSTTRENAHVLPDGWTWVDDRHARRDDGVAIWHSVMEDAWDHWRVEGLDFFVGHTKKTARSMSQWVDRTFPLNCRCGQEQPAVSQSGARDQASLNHRP